MEEKIEFILKYHEELKAERRELRDKVPYEKLNDRDKMHILVGRVSALTDVILLFKHNWTIEQIEKNKIL